MLPPSPPAGTTPLLILFRESAPQVVSGVEAILRLVAAAVVELAPFLPPHLALLPLLVWGWGSASIGRVGGLLEI